MTNESVQTTVKRHRPAALVGVIVGLGLLGGWVAYRALATPATPDVARASASEIVRYVSNPRGLGDLPRIQQEQFLLRWKERLMDEAARKELRGCFETMTEEGRKEFAGAIIQQFKRGFVGDAKRFAQMKVEEKSAFVRARVAEYRDQAVLLKEVAVVFKGLGGSRSDDFQQWILENTTAEERAVGEPYVDALKRVRELMKKEERAPNAGG